MICVQAWCNDNIHGLKLKSKATEYTPSNTRHNIHYISNDDILYNRSSTCKTINHYLHIVNYSCNGTFHASGVFNYFWHTGSKPLSFKPFIKQAKFSE